ncbi:MAG: hypothetical protein IKS69_06435, partial [Erysipelotrichaceae bacterium]|nr:hypothetical protein [Erysipelotrichaceae bacterium]
MKPENILLLGFVDKAAEYLDKHIDDDSGNAMAELRNIDLHSMQKVLSKNLDVSLGSMQATVQSLMKAGSDAFDAFIENHGDTGPLSAELDRLFDLDLEDGTSEDDIAKLMNYYNLQDDIDDQETAIAEQKEEQPVSDDAADDTLGDAVKDNDDTVDDNDDTVSDTVDDHVSDTQPDAA